MKTFNRVQKLVVLNSVVSRLNHAVRSEYYHLGICACVRASVESLYPRFDYWSAKMLLRSWGIYLPREKADGFCWSPTKRGMNARIRFVKRAILGVKKSR